MVECDLAVLCNINFSRPFLEVAKRRGIPIATDVHAIASHARIESPLFTHTLFGTYVGIMIWGGLILRNSTLRALIRNSAAGRDARWA